MGPIVCATRGGEASRRTQERAIALAGDRQLPLIFLYVADPSLDRPVDEALAAALADELERLGKRLLCIAQTRAREQGIDADMVVRRGLMQHTIKDFLREVNASALILGIPRTSSGTQAFGPDGVPEFAREIQTATGVEVVVVE